MDKGRGGASRDLFEVFVDGFVKARPLREPFLGPDSALCSALSLAGLRLMLQKREREHVVVFGD